MRTLLPLWRLEEYEVERGGELPPRRRGRGHRGHDGRRVGDGGGHDPAPAADAATMVVLEVDQHGPRSGRAADVAVNASAAPATSIAPRPLAIDHQCLPMHRNAARLKRLFAVVPSGSSSDRKQGRMRRPKRVCQSALLSRLASSFSSSLPPSFPIWACFFRTQTNEVRISGGGGGRRDPSRSFPGKHPAS